MSQHFEYQGWDIQTKSNSPILSSHHAERWQKSFSVSILPEMIFAENVVTFLHTPSLTTLSFTAEDALKEAKVNTTDSSHDIQVARAALWKNNTNDRLCIPNQGMLWTFQTPYCGSCVTRKTPTATSESALFEDCLETIDYEMLKDTSLPILFSSSVLLYEDELHDCGISRLNIRLRVMPKCFYILLRHWLRVDSVVSRLQDTRYFHRFEDSFVIREISVKEMPLGKVPDCQHGDVHFAHYDNPDEHEHLMTVQSKVTQKLLLQ